MSTLIEPIHNLALDLLDDVKKVREGKLSYKKAKEISNLSAQSIKAMSISLVQTKNLELQEKKLIMRNKELILKREVLDFKKNSFNE